jgi:hypothetical protein
MVGNGLAAEAVAPNGRTRAAPTVAIAVTKRIICVNREYRCMETSLMTFFLLISCLSLDFDSNSWNVVPIVKAAVMISK